MTTKTLLSIILLLSFTVLNTGRNAAASPTGNDTLTNKNVMMFLPPVEEESYIDDIPFDTRIIALESLLMNIASPVEESYIEDIPFDTRKIAAASQLLSIRPEDESYINDIPFSTTEIARNYRLNCLGNAGIETAE